MLTIEEGTLLERYGLWMVLVVMVIGIIVSVAAPV